MGSTTDWTFLHINDIHLGSPRSYRYRPALHKYWERIKEQMNAHSPEFLMIGGDLTRDGDTHEEEYRIVRNELELLPYPSHVIAGNMDVGNKCTQRQGGHGAYSQSAANVKSERLKLFANYFGPINWTFLHKEVRITGFYAGTTGSGLPEEADFWDFMQRLASLPKAKHHVAMMHYWLYIDDIQEKNFDPSKNDEYAQWYFGIDQPHRGRILEYLKKAGVEILFCGHVHTGRPVEEVEGIRVHKTPSTGNVAQMTHYDQIETRPGFQKCTVSAAGIDVEFIPCDREYSLMEGNYGPGGHTDIWNRDYSIALEKPALAPDHYLLGQIDALKQASSSSI